MRVFKAVDLNLYIIVSLLETNYLLYIIHTFNHIALIKINYLTSFVLVKNLRISWLCISLIFDFSVLVVVFVLFSIPLQFIIDAKKLASDGNAWFYYE